MKKVLVTGSAGFIGFHLSKKLLDHGYSVIGVDNFNDYYDVSLKEDRNSILEESKNFRLIRCDISNGIDLKKIFESESIDEVVHLAAQAGVRYSIENPDAYIQSNLVGFANILEIIRKNGLKRLVYASSSSVYGNSDDMPFKESQNVDRPVSLYAATKKSNELMAHSYTNLYGFETVGLRFFTVYGPWGRPDMAPFKFAKQVMNEGEIDLYNHGDHLRDFTYVDDIVEGIFELLKLEPRANSYEVLNIGCSSPVHLGEFVETLENSFDKKVKKNLLPMQLGDVYATFADVSALNERTGYQPSVSLKEGIAKFADWYKNYYKIKA